MQLYGHLAAACSCCTMDKCHPCGITNGWSNNYETSTHLPYCFHDSELGRQSNQKPEDDPSVNSCQVLQMIGKTGSVGQA